MKDANILLVNFQKIVGDGLRALLDQEKGRNTVSNAGSRKETVELCQKQDINLLILNIDDAEANNVELIQHLKENFPEVKVLALATTQKDQHIRQLFQAGVSGYILKDSDSEEFYKAIDTVLNGSLYFSEEITQAVMQRFIKDDEKNKRRVDPFSLTDREVEVLGLIVEEMTNQEIADQLSISVRTVESHRRNLLQKTGSRNTAGLVRYAIEKDIV